MNSKKVKRISNEMKVNVKVLGVVTIILLIALIAIYVFVPKHITVDQKLVTFKKTPAPNPPTDLTTEEIVE